MANALDSFIKNGNVNEDAMTDMNMNEMPEKKVHEDISIR